MHAGLGHDQRHQRYVGLGMDTTINDHWSNADKGCVSYASWLRGEMSFNLGTTLQPTSVIESLILLGDVKVSCDRLA